MNKLHEILNKKQIDIYTMSNDLNIAPTTLSKVLSGNYISSKSMLKKITNYLGITEMDYFSFVYNVDFIDFNKISESLIQADKEQFTSDSLMLRSSYYYYNLGYKKCLEDINKKLHHN